MQAAPVGLATAISSASITGTVATAKILAVTTLQKSLLAVVAVLVGALIYKSRQASEARNEVASLREQVGRFQRQQEETRIQNRQTSQAGEGQADDSHAAFAVMASGEGDGEVYSEEHAPSISYIDAGGTLSSAFMTKFGLSKEQFVKTQGVVSTHWGALATWAAKAIFQDDVASALATDGANVFRLPAMDPQQRQAILENFSRELRLATNNAAADAILAGLADNNAFGYMGKYDMVFRFTQMMSVAVDPKTLKPIGPQTPIPNEMSVNYDYMNPKTGTVVLSSKGADLVELSRMFGNIFQPEN